MGKEKKEKKPHPLSEPTVTDQREVMERGVESTICWDWGRELHLIIYRKDNCNIGNLHERTIIA